VTKSYTNSNAETLRTIQSNFNSNWPSSFRGEEFWLSLRQIDKCQLLAIDHMTL